MAIKSNNGRHCRSLSIEINHSAIDSSFIPFNVHVIDGKPLKRFNVIFLIMFLDYADMANSVLNGKRH